MTWRERLAAIFGKGRVGQDSGPAEREKTQREVEEHPQDPAVVDAVDRFRRTYEASENQQDRYNRASRRIAFFALVVAVFALLANGFQAWFSRDTLNETIRANEIGQRSWLLIKQVRFTRLTYNPNPALPETDTKWQLSVTLENVGRVPASVKKIWVNLRREPPSGICPTVGEEQPGTTQIISPRQDSAVPMHVWNPGISRIFEQAIHRMDDSPHLTVYGVLHYADAFRKTWTTRFCSTLVPSVTASNAETNKMQFAQCLLCNAWE